MRTRLVPRPVVAGFLLAVAVTGVAGCRTSPNVAAYVGDTEISVRELEDAVDARLEEEAVAAYAESRPDDFTRQVLGLLVQEEVYAEAGRRYDVEVADRDVRTRIEQLLQGQDADAVYEQLAAQGVARADVFENVRQQLLGQRIAEREGLAEGLSEEALRARYEEVRDSLAQQQMGFITVPDQATADAVLARLTADPATYPQLAARFAGDYTLPELQPLTQEQVPGPLAQAVAETEPGSGFTLSVEETGGIVVGYVGETVYPSFEEVRPQLAQEAEQAAAQAAGELVGEVREDLDVSVNPRYGVLEDAEIRPADGGVVQLLEGDGGSAAAGDGGSGG